MEEQTPRDGILHCETGRVEFNRAGIVSSKLANGKKVMDDLRSSKDIGMTKRTGSRLYGGDMKTRPRGGKKLSSRQSTRCGLAVSPSCC
jgi:hypothetical protein